MPFKSREARRAWENAWREKHRTEYNLAQRVYVEKWHRKNPDKIRAIARARHHRNKADPEVRARQKARCQKWKKSPKGRENRILDRNRRGGPVRAGLVSELLAAQNGICRLCPAELATTGYHIDHIFPVCRGGTNADENMELLCPSCNSTKGARVIAGLGPVLSAK